MNHESEDNEVIATPPGNPRSLLVRGRVIIRVVVDAAKETGEGYIKEAETRQYWKTCLYLQ